jgi:hypothetical protein
MGGHRCLRGSARTDFAQLSEWHSLEPPERRLHSLNPKAPQAVGGMVSVIDPVNHVVTTTIKFAIPGLRPEAIEPVRIALAKDRSTGFVALGPANWGVDHRRRGPRGQQVSSGGQWIWHLAFTPDQKYLLTTNRISNDVVGDRRYGSQGNQNGPGRRAPMGVPGANDRARAPEEGLASGAMILYTRK